MKNFLRALFFTAFLFFTATAQAALSFEEMRNLFRLQIDQTFPFTMQWRDLHHFGIGQAVVHPDHLELKVTIAFYGAGYYSRIDRGEFKISQDIHSIAEHPQLHALIESWKPEFEKAFAADPRLRVRFTFIYPDEVQELGLRAAHAQTFAAYNTELINRLADAGQQAYSEGAQSRPLPIILYPKQKPSVMSVTTWNPHLRPQHWIHRMGHLLGIKIEGYEIFDYPVTGIMNDEAEFRALKRRGIYPTIQEVEANSILLKVLGPRVPRSYQRALRSTLTPEANTLNAVSGTEDLGNRQLQRRAEERIQQQLRNPADCEKTVRRRINDRTGL